MYLYYRIVAKHELYNKYQHNNQNTVSVYKDIVEQNHRVQPNIVN